MNVEVRRYSLGRDSTLGLLYIDGAFACFTLEDTVRDGPKIFGKTAIPAGTYALRIVHGGRLDELFTRAYPGIHKGMIELQDVPDFTGIMIHTGVTDANTEGCVLISDAAEQNVSKEGSLVSLEEAHACYERVYPQIEGALTRGEAAQITIREVP